MRPQIIELPEEISSKIAAGEVVERPASCIKELVENAIDAKATKISCSVKGKGVELLRVVDNGFGMGKDEVEMALLPHTTSKLISEEDLFRIKTLGFRGEALPSIRKVAELEVLTRTEDESLGAYIKTKGDEIVEKRESARDVGTTITVRNLFYNLPARRKFLKSTRTELNNIIFNMYKLAIAYPEIGFSLTHDGKIIFEVSPENLKERLTHLFGREFFNTLRWIEFEKDNIKLFGYLSTPDTLSAGVREYIFVNKRPCKEKSIRRAIYEAYGVTLKDKFPSFFVFAELNEQLVDVNIHPRKDEVRFADEWKVRKILLAAIKKGLGIYPTTPWTKKQQLVEQFGTLEGTDFWQLHNRYVLAQTEDGLIIIDQHAAHERIAYERLLRESVGSQTLLFPIVVSLNPLEYGIFKEFKDIWEKLGFEAEEFGEKTVRITAVPGIFTEFNDAKFKEMLAEAREIGRLRENRWSGICKAIACKLAVKAKEKLAPEEMKSLVKGLLSTDVPYFCPHGRPTIVRMSLEELARKFGRPASSA
jgi:DNA mismatch repair protein MutL